MSQDKYFMLTMNNPGEEILFIPDWIGYAIWQKEVGESGTPHLQIYIECKTKRTFTKIRATFPGAHVEKRKGSQQQAINYCSKPETRVDGPWTHGEKTLLEQGKRTDLEPVVTALRAGQSLKRVAEDNPETYIKFFKGIERYKQITQTEVRSWMTELHIVWGPAGTGKSHLCNELAPNAYHLPEADGKIWWDGYDGHEDVIIDDFYGWIKMSMFLKLVDKWPLIVENKGGTTKFLAKRIFITSNTNWESWYRKHFEERPEHLEAFKRRITTVKHCMVKYTGEQVPYAPRP